MTAAPELAQARLLWCAAAIHARLVGQLDEPRREKVLSCVRAAADPDVLYRMSPALLARLGESAEARARIEDLRSRATDPYRGAPSQFAKWLGDVEASLP